MWCPLTRPRGSKCRTDKELLELTVGEDMYRYLRLAGTNAKTLTSLGHTYGGSPRLRKVRDCSPLLYCYGVRNCKDEVMSKGMA